MMIKKAVSILLAVSVLAGCASCSRNGTAGTQEQNTDLSSAQNTKKDNIKKISSSSISVFYDEYELFGEKKEYMRPVAASGDKIYWSSDLYSNYDMQQNETYTYITDFKTLETQTDSYDELLSRKKLVLRDENKIVYLTADDECKLVSFDISSGKSTEVSQKYTPHYYDTDSQGNIYLFDGSTLFVYSPQLEIINETDILSQLGPMGLENRFIYGMCVSDTGDVYFVISRKGVTHGLFFLNDNNSLEPLVSDITDLQDNVNSIFTDKNGNIVLCTGYGTVFTDVISPETGKTEYMYELYGVSDIFGPSEDHDLVYLKNDGIYGYDFREDTEKLIVSDESLPQLSELFCGSYISGDRMYFSLYASAGKSITVTGLESGTTEEYDCPAAGCALADVAADGTFFYVSSEHSIAGGENGSYETVLSSVFRLEENGTSTFLFSLPQYEDEVYPAGFKTDKNGNFIFLYPADNSSWDNSVLVISPQGNIIKTIDYPENTEGTESHNFNNIVSNENNELFISGTFGKEIFRYDADLMEISPVETGTDLYLVIYDGNSGYDFYFSSAAGISGYKAETGSTEEVLFWADIENTIVSIEKILIISPEIFVTSGGLKYVKADQARLDELNSKEIITLAVSMSGDILPYVSEFNKKSKDYRIMLKDYSKYGTNTFFNTGKASDALASDIINGDIPDIVMFDNMDLSSFITKEMFADLRPFVQKDPDTDISDFYSCITDAFTYRDSLYTIPAVFNANGCFTAEDHEKWDYDSLLSLSESGTNIFEAQGGMKDSLQYYLLNSYIADHVDMENRKCDFDNELFEKLITFINETGYLYDDNSDYELRQTEYSVMLEGFDSFNSYSFNISEDKWGTYTPYFKGMPSSDGSGHLFVYPFFSFGISNSSELKDGAWEFIKSVLTNSNSVSDKFGAVHSSRKADEKIISEYMDYAVTSVSSDILSSYSEALNMPGFSNLIYIDIFNTVKEETDMYFSGNVSAGQAASSIQHKVSLYLNEI